MDSQLPQPHYDSRVGGLLVAFLLLEMDDKFEIRIFTTAPVTARNRNRNHNN
jgi:hypothetical protein